MTDGRRSRPELTHAELERYGRHLALPEIGLAGQARLKAASVLLVGAGGLGAPVALYLAAAGVGRLGLVDFDRVETANLQRQILYATEDVGREKLAAARARLHGLNPHVRIETHTTRLDAHNGLDLLRSYDVVVDATDNFPARYLVNDACALLGKPDVYGSVSRFEGQVSVFWAARGPCYRCLHAAPPPEGLVPTCAEGGVLGVLPGIVGAIQAAQALELLLEVGEPLVGRVLLLEALPMRFRELRLRKDPDCPLCGAAPRIRSLAGAKAAPGSAACAPPPPQGDIDALALAAWLERADAPLLLDVREPHEWQACHIEPATHVPLRLLPERAATLPRDRAIVVYCRSGKRSARAAELLRAHGLTRVFNLAGGIRAWAAAVDPSLPSC